MVSDELARKYAILDQYMAVRRRKEEFERAVELLEINELLDAAAWMKQGCDRESALTLDLVERMDLTLREPRDDT